MLFSTIKLEFKLESRTSEFVCVFFFLRLLLLLYWLSFSGVTICLLYRFRQIIHNLFIFMDFLNIVEKETKKVRKFLFYFYLYYFFFFLFLVLCYRRFTLHTQSHTQFCSFWPLYQKWEEKNRLSRENWLLTWRSIRGALQNGDCWNEIATHFFRSAHKNPYRAAHIVALVCSIQLDTTLTHTHTPSV